MIDTIALVLGHALLATALLRLALRADVDQDPHIASLQAQARTQRQSKSAAARRVARDQAQTLPGQPDG
ncbi:MAG: hypothetical protein MUF47_10660 [Porphyrobacter sp.]|jgi:hypothetical protein|nr:hypothetical protein [Porphyrobacter sp.]